MDDDDTDTQARVAPARANYHDYLSAVFILGRGIASAWSDAFEVLALTHTVASSERAEREEFAKAGARWVETLPVAEDPRGR